MALTISKFLSRPYQLKDRDTIPSQFIQIQKVSKEDNGYTVRFRIKSISEPLKYYECIIWTNDPGVSIKSQVKVFCSCQSFQYPPRFLLHRSPHRLQSR